MNSDDPQADNIFSRLISYTPRRGKDGNQRTPLEDFCTEALAWCLINSDEFRRRFLGLVEDGFKGRPKDYAANISTQVKYNSDEDDSEDGQDNLDGRFDLVIQINRLVIVVESKVEDGLGPDQVEKYRWEIDKGKRFRNCETKLLVTLTKYKIDLPEKYLKRIDAQLRWRDVQKILQDISSIHPQDALQSSVPSMVILRQFSAFLKSKGMIFMNIPKPSADKSFQDGLRFCRAVSESLQGLVGDLQDKRLNNIFRSVPEWREVGSDLCLELRNKPSQPHFTLGFTVLPKRSIFGEAVWVKGPKNSPTIPLGTYYPWNDKKGFTVEVDLENSTWNSEQIEDYLRQIAVIVSNLQND